MKKIDQKRVDRILNLLQEKHWLEWCESYGEKGYSDPEKGILFANWNDVPKRIADYLEAAGFDLEWQDEWLISYSANKCYRTSPDSYGWSPYYLLNDWTNGEIIGGDEIEESEELALDYIYNYLLNDHHCINLFDIRGVLDKEGFTLWNNYPFENGFFEGMNDNPKDIAKQLEAAGFDFIFSDFDPSQFYCRFNVYIKKEEG
jgi:hypothetical protein